MNPAWRALPSGVSLSVKVSPRGGRDAVQGLVVDATGMAHVKVRVAAAPVDGAANQAVQTTIATWLGLKPRDVTLILGDASRSKVFQLAGDAAALTRKLQTLTSETL